MNNGEYNLPPEKEDALRRAQKLEYWSLFFLFTIIVAVGLTMGASQAMKAMWIEDTLSLVPTSAVLVGIYFRKKKPDDKFPYGYRRAVQICFLTGAVALFGFGVYILIDSVIKLIAAHHPTIQTIELFGARVWIGWLMIAALTYSVFPPLILGRMKLPLAKELHDKTLQTDATIDKGDWLAGAAGVAGIFGIAYGYWWADALAGAIISVEIVKDGIENLKNSVQQLMNMRPTDVENKEKDPVIDKVRQEIERLEWVEQSQIRLREDGDVISGEAFVVPRDENNLLEKLAQAGERVKSLDWRIYDFNIVPVSDIGSKNNIS
jgi:cation diffusion facilitator family transporter